MGIGQDRVQLIKRESASQGGQDNQDGPFGDPVPINPNEDAIEAAGIYLQDETYRDENVAVFRNGDDMSFKDVSNPTPKTLTELIAGTGALTEEAHKTLRQLIHFIDNGPAEGFASGAYREVTGTIFPTAIIWYTDGTKAEKIVELNITWSGVVVSQMEWKVWDTGSPQSVIATVTDAISYSGVFETSRTRTIAV